MKESNLPRTPEGVLTRPFARQLVRYADPEQPNDWEFNPKLRDALSIIAPDIKRPSFQRDVLHPVLLLGMSDLAKTVSTRGNIKKENIVPLPGEGLEKDLAYIASKVGEDLNDQADFSSSFVLETDQAVRLARYTVWGHESDLAIFQHDSIVSFFNMTNSIMLSVVQNASENGLIKNSAINLHLYSDLIRQPWFKKIILGSMDTGNGFLADVVSDIDSFEDDGIEDIREQVERMTSWWDVKGPLPNGPVSASPLLREALEHRKTEQHEGKTPTDGDYLTVNLPTDGCPIRHFKAVYSTDPKHINYLTDAQVARLTEGDTPLVVRDAAIPNLLHVKFSINSFLLDQYASALEKVT